MSDSSPGAPTAVCVDRSSTLPPSIREVFPLTGAVRGDGPEHIVHDEAYRSLARRFTDPQSRIYGEVPTAYGRVDLMRIRVSDEHRLGFAVDLARSSPAVLLRLASTLPRRALSERYLCARVGSENLDALADAQLIVRHRRAWVRAVLPHDCVSSVVAYEVKVRDYAYGIAQAATRLATASRAWLVVPTAEVFGRFRSREQDLLQRASVGVCTPSLRVLWPAGASRRLEPVSFNLLAANIVRVAETARP